MDEGFSKSLTVGAGTSQLQISFVTFIYMYITKEWHSISFPIINIRKILQLYNYSISKECKKNPTGTYKE